MSALTYRLLSAGLLAGLGLILLMGPARADLNKVIFEKQGEPFTLEDLALFYTEEAGGDGFLNYIQLIIIYQEGKRLGLSPTQEEREKFIDENLGRKVYQNYLEVFDQKKVDRLVDAFIVSKRYDDYIKQKLQKDLGIQVTEEEMRQFYIQNKTKIDKPERVEISIISVETEQEANQALAELRAGTPFDKVAVKYNQTPELKATAGYIGIVRRGQLPKELEDAAFKQAEGTYTEKPIKINNYNIIYVHRYLPEYNPSFDEIKDQIRQILLEQKLREPLAKHYSELIKKGIAEIIIKTPLFEPKEESPLKFGSAAK